ncbi:MAG TPA: hypothetical protein VI461_07810 [Chitinophagaceae bacterium]|nr:hypothetical protein [Chitinophagaceae bacterium]
MKKEKTPIAVYITTTILILYCLSALVNAPFRITAALFFIFPFFVVWMVLSVLKSKTGNIKELAEGEEWGYADKRKEDLGTF